MDNGLLQKYEFDPSLETFIKVGLLWVVAGVGVYYAIRNRPWKPSTKTAIRFLGASLLTLPFGLKRKE